MNTVFRWVEVASRLKKKLEVERKVVEKELQHLNTWRGYNHNKVVEVLSFLYDLSRREEQLYTRYHNGTKYFLERKQPIPEQISAEYQALENTLHQYQRQAQFFLEIIKKRRALLSQLAQHYPKVRLDSVERGIFFKHIDDDKLIAQTSVQEITVKKIHKEVLMLLKEQSRLEKKLRTGVKDQLTKQLLLLQAKIANNPQLTTSLVTISSALPLINCAASMFGLELHTPGAHYVSHIMKAFLNQ